MAGDNCKLVRLTPFEEKTWRFCFKSHLNRGYSPRRATELAWAAVQDIFPHLREFDGCEPVAASNETLSDPDQDDGQILGQQVWLL
jgi:hypothetical protein